jgi:hypothetical protein
MLFPFTDNDGNPKMDPTMTMSTLPMKQPTQLPIPYPPNNNGLTMTPMMADGLYTTNYYACLTNPDTDDDHDAYGNTNADDEYKNNGNIHTNGTNTITGTHTPSQPSSLHVISNLMSPLFPSPVPNNSY